MFIDMLFNFVNLSNLLIDTGNHKWQAKLTALSVVQVLWSLKIFIWFDFIWTAAAYVYTVQTNYILLCFSLYASPRLLSIWHVITKFNSRDVVACYYMSNGLYFNAIYTYIPWHISKTFNTHYGFFSAVSILIWNKITENEWTLFIFFLSQSWNILIFSYCWYVESLKTTTCHGDFHIKYQENMSEARRI